MNNNVLIGILFSSLLWVFALINTVFIGSGIGVDMSNFHLFPLIIVLVSGVGGFAALSLIGRYIKEEQEL